MQSRVRYQVFVRKKVKPDEKMVIFRESLSDFEIRNSKFELKIPHKQSSIVPLRMFLLVQVAFYRAPETHGPRSDVWQSQIGNRKSKITQNAFTCYGGAERCTVH